MGILGLKYYYINICLSSMIFDPPLDGKSSSGYYYVIQLIN